MIDQKRYIIVPFIYLLIVYVLIAVMDAETVSAISVEDSYFEYIGAAGLLAASVFFLVAFFRSRNTDDPRIKRLFYLVLALMFLFGGGEEISWGQRIFNYETPEAVEAVNEHDEFNIHNLEVGGEKMQLKVLIRYLFNLFWFGFTLVVPVLSALWKSAKERFSRFMPVVPWSFGLLFLANWGMMKIAMFVKNQGVNVGYTFHDLIEVYESSFGILFASVALYLVLRYIQQQLNGDKSGLSQKVNARNT